MSLWMGDRISSRSMVLTAFIQFSMLVQLFKSGVKLFQTREVLGKNEKYMSQFLRILYDRSCLVCLLLMAKWSVGMSIKFSLESSLFQLRPS